MKEINPECEECLDTSTSFQGVQDSLWQQSNLGEYRQLSLWKSTPTLKPSCDRSSQEFQFTQISETITPEQESLTSSHVDSLAQAHQTQELEQDSSIQLLLFGEKVSDALSKLNPASALLNNLKELSDEDFELFLEDSEWQDTLGKLKQSRRRSLERVTKDSDCLSFPTLTSNENSTSRPAGQTKCEKWFRNNGLIPNGSQLSSQAIAMIMGFPQNWFSSLSPTKPQEESEVDTSQGELLHQDKQRSLSVESSISQKLLGVNCKLERGGRSFPLRLSNHVVEPDLKLKHRVSVNRCDLKWAQNLVTEHHYLHRPIHPLSLPFAYSISLDGEVIGTIIMATIHYIKKKGLFGYEGLPTKWQVLQISRLWIDPKYQGRQSNGHANNIASCAIAKMLKVVNRDWLEHHPPRYPDQPYNIELIISYADKGVGHEGSIYKAANFQRWGETTNNRPRHGLSKGSKEPKILYVYRLERKSKFSSSTVLLGSKDNSPLSTENSSYAKRQRGTPHVPLGLNQKLSIPCLVKQPKQPEVKGVIRKDEGDRFVVDVDGEEISIPKLFVYPDFTKRDRQIPPTIKKTPPSKGVILVSRRKGLARMHVDRPHPKGKDSPLICEAVSFKKTRRKKGEGTGYIYRRTITRKGKQYQEDYFRYRDESGKLKAKYIPQTLLSKVEEAESLKLPVVDILFLLGGGEREARRTCVGKCNRAVEISRGEHSSICEAVSFRTSKVPSKNQSDRSNLLSRGEQPIPPSKNRRKQGEGTGYIECKPITRGGNKYKQYWFHYEEWRNSDRTAKKSRYIPMSLVARIEKLNAEKVPVEEILKFLGSRNKK